MVDIGRREVARFPAPHRPVPALPTPSASKARSADQSKDQQESDRADERIHDQGHNADPEMNTKARQEPIANECADKADDQIGDQPKAPRPASPCLPDIRQQLRPR